LTWQEVPDVVPRGGEVLIKVSAAGVNRADLLQAAGNYPPPPGASDILGLEVSGTVAAVADDVAGWSVGQPVCALLAGGGYAEFVAVPAGQVMPVPETVDLPHAAALPEVACTVWSNLAMTAQLRAGQVALIHGGASGIGTHAIQVCRALGSRVAVTAGAANKLDLCAELGADVTINYREEDFVERVREATEGAGADVILDIVGAKYLARNLDALATNGRLVVIGMQGGTKAELDLGALLAKRAAVLATSLRARPAAEKAAIVASVREHVWPLVQNGDVRPVIDMTFPLDRAGDAHRRLDASEHVGKVLLTV
jgi:putative PIG3 family NAD(P)H quinone oxidoreductase